MALQLSKIPSRTDYVETVYKVLLDAISDGTLAPGVRITQEEIALQMEVSRSPVLQALLLLKKDGFIQDAPGRGVLVTPLDAAWIGKVYEVRGALDALAARLAAERGARIDPRLIDSGRAVAAGSDVRAMIEADLAFHNAIYEASGNDLIAQSAQLHWAHLRRVMGAVLQTSSQRASVWDEHQAIVDAIASGDGQAAAALIEGHTRHARKNLAQRMGEVLMKTADVPAQPAA